MKTFVPSKRVFAYHNAWALGMGTLLEGSFQGKSAWKNFLLFTRLAFSWFSM